MSAPTQECNPPPCGKVNFTDCKHRRDVNKCGAEYSHFALRMWIAGS